MRTLIRETATGVPRVQEAHLLLGQEGLHDGVGAGVRALELCKLVLLRLPVPGVHAEPKPRVCLRLLAGLRIHGVRGLDERWRGRSKPPVEALALLGAEVRASRVGGALLEAEVADATVVVVLGVTARTVVVVALHRLDARLRVRDDGPRDQQGATLLWPLRAIARCLDLLRRGAHHGCGTGTCREQQGRDTEPAHCFRLGWEGKGPGFGST